MQTTSDVKPIQLELLGNATVRIDGEIYSNFVTKKSEALLLFLVYTGEVFRRDYLANLLWSNSSQERASANLRYVLTDLRKAFDNYLNITRQSISVATNVNFELDTLLLDKYLQQPSIEIDDILSLYKGEFLQGFHVRNAVDFSHWMTIEREKWHVRLIHVLSELVTNAIRDHHYKNGLTAVERLLEIDPLNEHAHQQKLSLLAWSGKRAAALHYYEDIIHLLDNELSVQPAAETTSIYNQIKNGAYQPPSQAVMPSLPSIRHNLPAQITPFIGREHETEALSHLLTSTDNRLITILAMGGMGKTRLSLEVAKRQLNKFEDGIFYIELAHLPANTNIIPQIALSLDCQLQSDIQEPIDQLLAFLRDKMLLLVLDNFEHLQSNATTILKILQAAPRLKILVTSRQRLNVLGEYVFRLQAFSIDQWKTVDQAIEYPAVKLFVDNAQRIRSDFELTQHNLKAVANICSIVGGLPLGLLIASSWISALSPKDIVHNLAESLHLMTTDMKGLSKRHRDISMVFDFTWHLLEDTDRHTFMRLSVFQGGFTLEAAQKVTDATFQVISNLLNFSFIQKDSNHNRFTIHELLRRYGKDKLEASTLMHQTSIHHLNYYMSFIQQREDDLISRRQLEAIQEIRIDIENVKKAWHYALDNLDQTTIMALDNMILGLLRFFRIEDRWQEGYELFHKAVQRIETNGIEAHCSRFGLLLIAYSNCLFFLNNIHGAEVAAQKGLAVARMNNDLIAQLVGAQGLGIFLQILGKVDEAEHVIENGLRIAQDYGDPYQLARTLLSQGFIARMNNDIQLTTECCYQCLPVFRRMGDQFFLTQALNDLGNAVAYLGNYAEAVSYFKEAVNILRALHADQTVLTFQLTLGYFAYILGNLDEAEHYSKQSLDVAKRYNHSYNIGAGLRLLSQIALAKGQWNQAYEMGLQASQLTNGVLSYHESVLGPIHVGFALWGQEQYEMATVHLLETIQLCVNESAPLFRVFALQLSLFLLEQRGQYADAVGIIAYLVEQHKPMIFPRWYLTEHALWTPFVNDLRISRGEDVFQDVWERDTAFDVEITAHALLDSLH